MQSSFGSLRVVGTANNAVLPVLKQVGLPDNDRYEFEYTNAAQVSVIRRFRADGTQPFYNVFQYESSSTDCPRLSQTRVAAENWTSLNGVPGEVTTYFAVDPDGACRMTAPDGTDLQGVLRHWLAEGSDYVERSLVWWRQTEMDHDRLDAGQHLRQL